MVLAAYFKQDGLCVYCKGSVNDRNATWEHVIPRGWGGPESGYNIVLACEQCNGLKSGIESYITNQLDRSLDLTSRGALFMLRCAKLFRSSNKSVEFRMRYFHMAHDMLRAVDYHMEVAGKAVPAIPKSERSKFF